MRIVARMEKQAQICKVTVGVNLSENVHLKDKK
jgi:hypothetical protein